MKQITILVLSILPLIGYSQARTDFQTWYGTQLKIDMPKGWAISGQYRLRITENATHYKGSYFFGQVDKRLNKNLLLTSNYRLALVDKGTYHRYALGLEARTKTKNWEFVLRPMVQYQKQNFSGDDEGKIDTDTYLRSRLTVKYAINRRFDAYIYAEPFYDVDSNLKIDWWKNSAGFKYEFAKNMKLNLYYIWQPDFTHKKYALTNHIIGIDLEFTLKP